MALLLSVIVFLLVFSALVLVHEWGHYKAAKVSKVTVEEFGLGFGKRIWGFHKDGTDFNINLIPFGGFVRMLGEEESSDAPGSFEKAPLLNRMMITVAGVIMNWIFAIILLFALFIHGTDPILLSKADLNWAISQGYVEQLPVSDQLSEEEGAEAAAAGPAYKFVKQIKLPVGEAAVKAVTETGRISKAIVVRLSEIPGEIIRERRFPEGLTGPLGIAEVTHRVVPRGIWEILKLTALLSISLAVMNLLPIPALDGGRLVLQLFELITRRKPNEVWEHRLHYAGFVFLMALIFAVTWNDIMRMFFS
ncbi:MAG TPA: site-2 protease family protein [Candidatus Gracilibacteria bacterium]